MIAGSSMIEQWLRFAIVWRLSYLAGAALAAMLTGCTSPPPVVPEAPSGPRIALLPVQAPDTKADKAVKRDTAALRREARQFLARPSVPGDAVQTLDPLNRAMADALRQMERHHTRRGYRPADVARVRATADALADYINTHAAPLPATGGGSDFEPSPDP